MAPSPFLQQLFSAYGINRKPSKLVKTKNSLATRTGLGENEDGQADRFLEHNADLLKRTHADATKEKFGILTAVLSELPKWASITIAIMVSVLLIALVIPALIGLYIAYKGSKNKQRIIVLFWSMVAAILAYMYLPR